MVGRSYGYVLQVARSSLKGTSKMEKDAGGREEKAQEDPSISEAKEFFFVEPSSHFLFAFARPALERTIQHVIPLLKFSKFNLAQEVLLFYRLDTCAFGRN